MAVPAECGLMRREDIPSRHFQGMIILTMLTYRVGQPTYAPVSGAAMIATSRNVHGDSSPERRGTPVQAIAVPPSVSCWSDSCNLVVQGDNMRSQLLIYKTQKVMAFPAGYKSPAFPAQLLVSLRQPSPIDLDLLCPVTSSTKATAICHNEDHWNPHDGRFGPVPGYVSQRRSRKAPEQLQHSAPLRGHMLL